MLTEQDLDQDQLWAIDQLFDLDDALILADMGKGKTVITLTHLLDTEATALVLAPKRVAETVWHQEIQQWAHLKGKVSCGVATGAPRQRQNVLRGNQQIHVINNDNITWLSNNLMYGRYDVLVIDELSKWKGMGIWWKTLMAMRPAFKRVIGLTGTPAPNGMMDLWPQAQLVHPGMITRTKTLYKQKYFFPVDVDARQWELRDGMMEEILDFIEPYTIRLVNDEKDMPDLHVNRIPVPLPEPVKELIRELRNQGMITLEDGTEIVGDSAAVQQMKENQIANGKVYDEHKNVHHIHDCKAKALEELVSEMQGEPVLICYNFKHDLEAIRKLYPDAPCFDDKGIDAAELVAAWNAGEIPILLGHPASMGHGLNMQKGGHHIVFYGLTWDLDNYLQVVARLWRRGQRGKEVFVHLLCAGALDNVIANALISKEDVQQAVLDYFAEGN